jgi:hypothetical protein
MKCHSKSKDAKKNNKSNEALDVPKTVECDYDATTPEDDGYTRIGSPSDKVIHLYVSGISQALVEKYFVLIDRHFGMYGELFSPSSLQLLNGVVLGS